MLEKCFVRWPLQSLVSWHSVRLIPGLAGGSLSRAASHAPVCAQSSGVLVPPVSVALYRMTCRKDRLCPCLFPQRGLCHPAKGRAGEGRISIKIPMRSAWHVLDLVSDWGPCVCQVLWLTGTVKSDTTGRKDLGFDGDKSLLQQRQQHFHQIESARGTKDLRLSRS